MQITTHILPRRVVLWSIVLAGLGLRLWGLDWGPEGAGALHPGEWTWQIIQHLGWDSPTYPGLWTQAFFSLAALVHGALGMVASWWQVLLGQVHAATEVETAARLAGRITVAFMGAGQVLLVYLVGRRYFDSVATGLVAAGLVAVSPLSVTHSHYLSLDIPLGLAILFCLWSAWWLMEYPRVWAMAVAGLVLGLTITTRASGALMILPLAASFVIGVRRARPAPSRTFALWPLAMLGGLLLGLLLGYPGFILASDQTAELIQASLTLPPLSGQGLGSFVVGRLGRMLALIGRGVGVELMLLWLAGLGLCLWRRSWGRLLIALVPLVYLVAGVTVLRGSLEGLAAAWVPAMAVLAAWPVVWLCRRLPHYSWAVAGVSILGVLICLWPLWRALGADYLFWQQDTLSSARFWVQGNLPAGSKLLLGPRTPLGVFPAGQAWREPPAAQSADPPKDYLLVSALSWEHQADPWEDWTPPRPSPRLAGMEERMQLLQVFDLKGGWNEAPGGDQASFPRWVSPRVEVYAPLPPLQVRQPLALNRPPLGSQRPYAMVYTDHPEYGRDATVMSLGRDGLGHRVLFNRRGIGGMSLVLSNQGEDLARVEVSQSPWRTWSASLYPGQEVDLELGAQAWPPMNRACYPVRARLDQGGRVLARVLWDPLSRARRALEQDRYEEVVDLLTPLAADGSQGFEPRAMLAEALVRLGRFDQAVEVLEPLERVDGGVGSAYRALATAADIGPQWQESFRRFTGYHYSLLQEAASITCPVEGPPCRDAGHQTPLAGRGFQGAYLPGIGDKGDELRLWLGESLPPGQFRAWLDFRAPQGGFAGAELVLAEVWSHGQPGSRVLAARRLSGHDLARDQGRMELPFVVRREGVSLEVRLTYAPGKALFLRQARVGVDIPAHMRHMLRWYLDAQAMTALSAKRYPQAAEAFGALLALAPGFRPAYIPAARALLDMGKMEEALERARGAEILFINQPERLAQVGELYKQMQKPEDEARVTQRLAHLRPSLKREARFAGGLTLLGYDLSPAQVAPGGTLDVSYYWRCWAKPPLNYFVFVHLLGQGRRVTYDHLLDHGRISMTNLEPGEVVREDYQMQVPVDLAPGKYKLVVGLWDPKHTGKGVPVVEGQGAGSEEVELATVEVKAPGQGGGS